MPPPPAPLPPAGPPRWVSVPGAGAVRCRFDDVGAGEAWELTGPRGVATAHRHADVGPLLGLVDRAVADGDHVAGWVAYEAAAAFDPALAVRAPAPGDAPLAWFARFGGRRPSPQLPAGGPGPGAPTAAGPGWSGDLDAGGHAAAVAEVRRRIAAGDVYQVNLTDRLRRPWPAGPPGAVGHAYRSLVAAQQGAHHALLQSPERSVLCASPELFFALDGRRLASRPMKGTARRGAPAGGAADRRLAAGLRASPKERAENVMIVDLVRNDVGRLAEVGTVAVPALCAVEAFPTVWQLTSTVTGRVPAGTGVRACFEALFPPGSVTGAPKAAATRVIADLERSPRGVYCGAVGWAGPGPAGPRARFAVAIRTLVVEHATGQAAYGVGGGITWASTAAGEWAECRAKAAVLGALDPPDGVRGRTPVGAAEGVRRAPPAEALPR